MKLLCRYCFEIFIVYLLISCSNQVPATQIELPPLFTDHMVLQQDMNTPVWGRANPSGTVIVEFNNQKIKTVADEIGKWKAILKPQKAGGPYQMKIIGLDTIIIQDVFVGEVWIGSGQSNMEMPLAGWGKVFNYKQEIEEANYPDIRLFQVKHNISLKPTKLIQSEGWKVCTPENIPEFSSTAYFFARRLFKELKMPIGIIHSSWGGTIIEAWMSANSLSTMPEFQDKLIEISDIVKNHENSGADKPIENILEVIQRRWEKEVRMKDRGFNDSKAKWSSSKIDMTGWKSMQLPSVWENSGLDGLDGIVWFRKEVELPSFWEGKSIELHLSAVDDVDSTYFNGEFVGSSNIWDAPRKYTINKNLVKRGRNVIAVRVQDNQGGGGIWGDPNFLKLVLNKKNELSLVGEWNYSIGLDLTELSTPSLRPNNPNYPTVLSNSMIESLIPYAIKGVIWYQGESNADRAYQYRKLFPGLIQDWRKRWGQGDFPFLFTQLASYMDKKEEPGEDSWAELREAQLMTLSEPNTGMAVAIDIGDVKDIHPKNKQEVGRRLALNALKIAYQKELYFSGPIYKDMKIEIGKIRVSFDHVAGGLKTINDEKLHGFSIAGEDKKFVWANAKIDKSEIVIWSQKVRNPTAVRYGWEANPNCNLINSAGLPASPFRTDTWPGITSGK